MLNLIKFRKFVHQILSVNQILTITKGHNHVINLRKLTRNNPDIDPVNVNAYARADQIRSIRSQDTERKQNSYDYQGTLTHLLICEN